MRFDELGGIAWKLANKALTKAVDVLVSISNKIDIASKTCNTLISAFPGSSAPCTVPFVISLTLLDILKWVFIIASVLSQGIYDLVVDGQNNRFEEQRKEYTYDNVNIVHDNVISNFKLGQQLKLLLGGVLEALPSNGGKDDETQRRLAVDCKDADKMVFALITPKFCVRIQNIYAMVSVSIGIMLRL